jgi:hypothetical protein
MEMGVENPGRGLETADLEGGCGQWERAGRGGEGEYPGAGKGLIGKRDKGKCVRGLDGGI